MYGTMTTSEKSTLQILMAAKELTPSEDETYSILASKASTRTIKTLKSGITPEMKREWTADTYVVKKCDEFYIQSLSSPSHTNLTREDRDLCYMICKAGNDEKLKAVVEALPEHLKSQWLNMTFEFWWAKKTYEGCHLNPCRDPRQGARPLHIAAIHEHPDLVEYLVKQGAEINATNTFENTPLHVVAANPKEYSGDNALPTLKKLIELQADQSCKNQNDLTPFDLAIHYRFGLNLDDQATLPKNAQELLKFAPDSIKKRALHSAISYSNEAVSNKLLEAPTTDLSYRDKDGNTALHTCLTRGRDKFARKILCKEGVRLDLKNHLGDTPLHSHAKAYKRFNKDVTELLIQHSANRFALNHKEKTPFDIALQREDWRFLHLMLTSPLNACEEKNPEKNMLMLSMIAKTPEDADIHFETALCDKHLTSLKQLKTITFQKRLNLLLHMAASSGNIEAFKLFLYYEADINSTSDKGYSALHFALIHNRTGIAKYILQHQGVNVNQASLIGTTPLHHATKRGNTEIVKLLLGKGANPLISTTNTPSGLTPANLAKTKLERMSQIKVFTKEELSKVYEKPIGMAGMHPVFASLNDETTRQLEQKNNFRAILEMLSKAEKVFQSKGKHNVKQ